MYYVPNDISAQQPQMLGLYTLFNPVFITQHKICDNTRLFISFGAIMSPGATSFLSDERRCGAVVRLLLWSGSVTHTTTQRKEPRKYKLRQNHACWHSHVCWHIIARSKVGPIVYFTHAVQSCTGCEVRPRQSRFALAAVGPS